MLVTRCWSLIIDQLVNQLSLLKLPTATCLLPTIFFLLIVNFTLHQLLLALHCIQFNSKIVNNKLLTIGCILTHIELKNFLQVFFFVTNLLGWWQWTHPKQNEANFNKELKISKLSLRDAFALIGIGLLATLLMGKFSQNLHEISPELFSKPSAFPYMDSFTTVMSIVATFFLIRKKVESWYLWLLVDIIAAYMYYAKGVKLYSLLYAVFCVIALFGALNWTKEYRSYAFKTKDGEK